jgi:hypothetical protein
MSRLKLSEIELADILVAGMMRRGTGGNVVKGLAELIKNSDDAYHRLQQKNVETTGIIEVGYWSLKKNQRKTISAFYVRDYGNGMSRENAIKAYGSYNQFKVKSHGAQTAGSVRNGAIGVGGKDALYAMKDVMIITTHDKKPTFIELSTNSKGRAETGISSDMEDIQPIVDQINGMISPYCDPVDPYKDGTFVMYQLPPLASGLRDDTLKKGLEYYYTLRNIANGKNKTKLKLIHVSTGERRYIDYNEPDSEIISKLEPFKIPHTNQKGHQEHYQVDVEIKRATDVRLEKEKDSGENFIIENGKGGILDNHMFGFQNDPAAAKIFGNIIIHNWQELYADDKGVLPENREGLLWSHSFNRELESRIVGFLKPILDTERRQLEPSKQTNRELNKKMDTALAFLNKLMKEDEYFGGEQPSSPPEIMEFSHGRMKIIPGKTKKIKLFINPDEIPEFSPISTVITEGENAGVTVYPEGIVKTPDRYNYPPYIPYIEFEITGNEQGANSHLKAYFQNYETEVSISVVPESELYPLDGFAFVPPTAKFVKGKQKRLRLVIDTHMIKPGTIIGIESEDERVTLPFSRITVSEPNMGKYLTEEFFYVICNEPRIKTSILAKTMTTKGEERVAVCKVKVVEKEERKMFFKGFEFLPSGDPRVRGTFRDGIVYIHTSNPVLQFYFGTNQDRLSNNITRDAVAMLANTVGDIAFREWAKKRIEDGAKLIMDETKRDEEIELEKGNLERQYGMHLHKTLAAKYHSDKI